jgi:hypothetical protein
MSQPRCLPVTLLASVFLAMLLLSGTSIVWAVEIEGSVQSVDVAARKLSITRKTAGGEKTVVLDVSAAAGDLSYLKKGDKVALAYDPEQEVVTHITADEGPRSVSLLEEWVFHDVFGNGITERQSLDRTTEDGVLIIPSGTGAICLASRGDHDDYRLSLEYMLVSPDDNGVPFLSVASTPPNPKGNDWIQKMPFGIELKLWPGKCGDVVLPPNGFRAERFPGHQIDPKDPRNFPCRARPAIQFGQWNRLEVDCRKNGTVEFSINGSIVNAVYKAERTNGRIVLFPGKAGMKIRNAVISKQ